MVESPPARLARHCLSHANDERHILLHPHANELFTRDTQLMAWALRLPLVSSVITGATRVQQVENNARAAEVTLSDDVVRQIDLILGNAPS